MEHAIERQGTGTKGAFFVMKDSQQIAEMTRSRTHTTPIVIDHTAIDASLSGQGAGKRPLVALGQWARGSRTQVLLLCPFAKAQYAKDAALREFLA